MATLPDATRNGIAEYIRDLLDADTSPGYIEFQTSTPSEVATCTLSDPCAGSATSGTITFNSISDDTNATGGTIASDGVVLKDGAGTEVISATIATTSSQELQIGNLTITAASTVGVSSLTLTVPAT